MIKFILNEKEIHSELPAGTLLLDFIRYHKNLMGTKIGCREGDCGACTVLIGEIKNNELEYRSMTSCLIALGNINNKHVVTIEGINMDNLNPMQQAMSDEGGTQCGFCTPGFVVSLAGFCLSKNEPTYANAIAAIDGNICRCTGYKSIERAATKCYKFIGRKNKVVMQFCMQLLKKYCLHILIRIKDRLKKLTALENDVLKNITNQKIFRRRNRFICSAT